MWKRLSNFALRKAKIILAIILFLPFFFIYCFETVDLLPIVEYGCKSYQGRSPFGCVLERRLNWRNLLIASFITTTSTYLASSLIVKKIYQQAQVHDERKRNNNSDNS